MRVDFVCRILVQSAVTCGHERSASRRFTTRSSFSARLFLSFYPFVSSKFFFFFFFVIFVLQRAFFYFICTVSGCDGGNRTRNIAVYTWRFSPLSYDRHPNATTVNFLMRYYTGGLTFGVFFPMDIKVPVPV